MVEDEILSYPTINSPAEVKHPTPDLISIARHPDTQIVDNDLPGDEECTQNEEDPLKVEGFFSAIILLDEGDPGRNGFFASTIYTITSTRT